MTLVLAGMVIRRRICVSLFLDLQMLVAACKAPILAWTAAIGGVVMIGQRGKLHS